MFCILKLSYLNSVFCCFQLCFLRNMFYCWIHHHQFSAFKLNGTLQFFVSISSASFVQFASQLSFSLMSALMLIQFKANTHTHMHMPSKTWQDLIFALSLAFSSLHLLDRLFLPSSFSTFLSVNFGTWSTASALSLPTQFGFTFSLVTRAQCQCVWALLCWLSAFDRTFTALAAETWKTPLLQKRTKETQTLSPSWLVSFSLHTQPHTHTWLGTFQKCTQKEEATWASGKNRESEREREREKERERGDKSHHSAAASSLPWSSLPAFPFLCFFNPHLIRLLGGFPLPPSTKHMFSGVRAHLNCQLKATKSLLLLKLAEVVG